MRRSASDATMRANLVWYSRRCNAVEAGCQGTTVPILVAAGRARPNAPDRALVDIRITCTTIVIIVIIISCR